MDAIKLGDKLEAVVKDNPNIVAVATVIVINGREISVHFDGWNKDHDYTASLDSGMLMPSGTQASLGKNFIHLISMKVNLIGKIILTQLALVQLLLLSDYKK